MLTLIIPQKEYFDDENSEFVIIPELTLEFEHSLVALYAWESKWEKPFLGKEGKTTKETISYIETMCLTPNVKSEVFNNLSSKQHEEISRYINADMTATTFNVRTNRSFSREIITAEIIYYWMIQLQIPFECQYWHLNKLLTLIKVCNAKNAPPKKMSRTELLSRQRSLNAQRRAQLNSRG